MAYQPLLGYLKVKSVFSSRIWTRVAVSISYDDNYYTTSTSFYSISTIVGKCCDADKKKTWGMQKGW